MATTNFEDFYEVANLNFDISKLRDDLNKILQNKKFNSPGVTHFGAIPINQIPKKVYGRIRKPLYYLVEVEGVEPPTLRI